jgi:membrane protease YdiL (CAAX protease family)
MTRGPDRIPERSIISRIVALLACGAAWMLLQWFFYSIVPGSETAFLRGGIASFLSALPLLAAAYLFPMRRCRLWGVKGGLPSLAVTTVLIVPFAAVAIFRGLVWIYPGGTWLATASLLLLLAAAEEMVFRGFLLNVLAFRDSFLFSAVVSSILFAAVHADNYGATVLGVVNVALFGLMLAQLRRVSDGLLIPVAVHWIWNLVTGMVFGWRVSGYELPSLWGNPDGGPWGTFGPEGSVLLTVSIAAGIALSLYLQRRSSCDADSV